MKSCFYITFLVDKFKRIYFDPDNIEMLIVEESREYSEEKNKAYKFCLTLNIAPHYLEGYVMQKEDRDHEHWLSSRQYRSHSDTGSHRALMGLKYLREFLK